LNIWIWFQRSRKFSSLDSSYDKMVKTIEIS